MVVPIGDRGDVVAANPMEIAPLLYRQAGRTVRHDWARVLDEDPGPARVDPVAGGFRQPHRSAEFLSVRARRLRGRTADGCLADAWSVCRLLRAHRRAADRQPVAWAL